MYTVQSNILMEMVREGIFGTERIQGADRYEKRMDALPAIVNIVPKTTDVRSLVWRAVCCVVDSEVR